MKTRLTVAVLIGLTVVLGCGSTLRAQLTPRELASHGEWENFLKTAAITGSEQISSRYAVTSPWILTLAKDGVTHKALWKNAEGIMSGYYEGWRYEIAAYRLDRLIGLNMVPPTVERRSREDRGSCQLWMDDTITLKTRDEKKIRTPANRLSDWNRMIYLQRCWDNLIANEDRHQNQILVTKDWRMILIDHSRTFRTSKKFTETLIFSERSPEGPRIMSELPRAVVERVKGLNHDLIKTATEDYLTDKEIRAVLTRRDLILAEIDKLIKKNGEARVLY